MASPYLVLVFLLTVAFSLATQLSVCREQSPHQQSRAGGILEILMGDSRRLFANHFITKADVYLHGGVYPSIFDQAASAEQAHERSHLAAASDSPGNRSGLQAGHSAHDAHESGTMHPDEQAHDGLDHPDAASGFLRQPRDWIDAFGRNFLPSRHIHLDEADQREILPWFRLAAELNPNEVETYTVGAYWLRARMDKVNEAEIFLREGWRANPDSFEILFELGRLYEENRNDDSRARNLYEAALRKRQNLAAAQRDPDDVVFMQITGHLARLENRVGNLDQAIRYFEMLQKVSPSPESVQKQIDELKEAKGRAF